MSDRLMLSVNADLIEKAKKFAKTQNQSLSKIVSEFLKSIVVPTEESLPLDPRLQKLHNEAKKLMKAKHMKGAPKNYKEFKSEFKYNDYLNEKSPD